jgi:hypothetical protein
MPVQSHRACPAGRVVDVEVDDVVVLLDVLELVLLDELLEEVEVLVLVLLDDVLLVVLLEVDVVDVAPGSVLVVGPGMVELVDELDVAVVELLLVDELLDVLELDVDEEVLVDNVLLEVDVLELEVDVVEAGDTSTGKSTTSQLHLALFGGSASDTDRQLSSSSLFGAVSQVVHTVVSSRPSSFSSTHRSTTGPMW